MATVISTEGKSTESKPRRRRKRGSDRWLSEVKGIVALLAAGFALIALATFDPTLTPAEQPGLTGPVGVWLGWATFQSFGYSGVLLPLLLGAWGASAFLRPIVVRGWVPLVGLGVLVVSAAGLLTQATRNGAVGGGLVGYAAIGVLHSGFGEVGTWLMLIAAIPIGLLCVTRVSYAAVVRVTTSRLTKLRKRRVQSATAARIPVEPDLMLEAQAPQIMAPPVVASPCSARRPRGRAAEQGLAWQENFDFGGGGAAAFQLPPVGLLKPPPASELKRTREELQDNAGTIRRKLQDFEVEGRIVQVSPGPITTSYEFEVMIGPGLTWTMRPSTSKSCSLRRIVPALSCSSSRVRLSSLAGGGLSSPTGGSWKAAAPPPPKSKFSCHASPCSARRPRGRAGSTTTGGAMICGACASSIKSGSTGMRAAVADCTRRFRSLVSRDVVTRTTAA